MRASKGLGRKRKKVVENNYLLKFHTWSPLDSYLDSFTEAKQKEEVEEEDKKVCERLTSLRTIIGERRPYDRYDVRSRDCHTTDAHVS